MPTNKFRSIVIVFWLIYRRGLLAQNCITSFAAGSFNYMIWPTGLVFHRNGTLFVTDRFNHGILQVSPSGAMSVFAGGTGSGATNGHRLGVAKFFNPSGIVFDSNDNMYVADTSNHRIRRIRPNGVVSDLAGNTAAFADGPATTARFSGPQEMTIFNNILYVADFTNNRIRGVLLNGTTFTYAGSGATSSINGVGLNATFNRPFGITVNNKGVLYVSQIHMIRLIYPNRTVVTLAGNTALGNVNAQGTSARFNLPYGIALTSNGNLVVVDGANNGVRLVTPTGVVSRLSGVNGIGYADGPASFARFWTPYGVTIDASDNIYVADYWNHAVRKIHLNGTAETYLDPGFGYKNGLPQEAKFDRPMAMTMDHDGSIVVADTYTNTVRRVSLSSNRVETLGGDHANGRVDGMAAQSRFRVPIGVAVDPDTGKIYVSDNYAVIRTINPEGNVSTLVGDGTPGIVNSVGSLARFHNPQGLTIRNGELYAADLTNNAIRRITIANRSVTTFAGSVAGAADGMGTSATFRSPIDVVWSELDQKFYVSDNANHLIRAITPQGNVSTFAGGTTAAFVDGIAQEARFNAPRSLALDTLGNLYVADFTNHAVRKVLPDGNVTTLVRGTGSGNIYNWPKNFTLINPSGIAVSSDETIYVTDASSRIWSFVCSAGPMRPVIENPIYVEPPVNPWDDIAYEETSPPSAPIAVATSPIAAATSTQATSTSKVFVSKLTSTTWTSRTISVETIVSNEKTNDTQTWLDKTLLNLPVMTLLIIASIAFVFILMAMGFGIYYYRRRRGSNKRRRKYTATTTDSSPTRSFIVPMNDNRAQW